MDRRDLLKRFGIGAIIAPVIGGVAVREATATLIEVPKIKPVELFAKIPEPIRLSQVKRASVHLEMFDGTVRTVQVQDVCTNSYDESISDPHGVLRPTDDLMVKVRFAQIGRGSPSHFSTLGEIYGGGTIA